jgi:hypothetical protein
VARTAFKSDQPVGAAQVANASAAPGSFTAFISWGDGQSSYGAVTASASGIPGAFDVQGTHTYATAGDYTIEVAIVNSQGNTDVSASDVLVSQPVLVASPDSFSATEGQTYNGLVATLTDPKAASAADVTATINWGDGNTSTGTVALSSDGNPADFVVQAGHKYATPGSYTVVITLSDKTGDNQQITDTATVAPALTGTSANFNALQNAPVTGVVATFADTDGNTDPTEYSAVINWGDTQTSTGTIVANAGGSFSVVASDAYSSLGLFPVAVAIVDSDGDTLTTTCQATVNAQGTIAWTGLGGDSQWSTAANWSNRAGRSPLDDVVINAPGQTISATGPIAAHTLQSSAALSVTGSLELDAFSQITGAFNIQPVPRIRVSGWRPSLPAPDFAGAGLFFGGGICPLQRALSAANGLTAADFGEAQVKGVA